MWDGWDIIDPAIVKELAPHAALVSMVVISKRTKITTRIPTNVQNNTLGQHSHTLKKKLECFTILHKLLWNKVRRDGARSQILRLTCPISTAVASQFSRTSLEGDVSGSEVG
jgi:hypothetical protein